MSSNQYSALTALAAACLALTACGGGSGSGSDSADSASFNEQALEQPPTSDDVPALSALVAPLAFSSGRETAQATSCPAEQFENPKVGAWDMTRDTTTARRSLLAQFDLAVLNMPPDSRAATFTAGVRSLNSGIKLAQYLNFPDVRRSPAATDYAYKLAQEITARGWWLENSAGTEVSFTSGSTIAVNDTAWAPANASGQRYPQFKARHDYDIYFASNTGLDYAFTANTWARPRVDADWRRNGTNQSRNDSAVQSAMRAGYAAYWTSLRGLKPGIKIMGGLDNYNNLSFAEYKGKLDGAFLDGMMGKPWSLETTSGWDAMMAHYRTVMANTGGEKSVVFSVYGKSPTDYATLRFGLASSLMNDGVFMFIPASGSQVPAWYDEYSAKLGNPIEAARTAPSSNGIWMRKFENGIALVNPRNVSASINVGSGYQRLTGSQDPTINNGAQQSTVTLGPKQGLLMVKVAEPCVEPEPTPTPTPTPVPTSPTPTPTPEPTPAPEPSTGFATPRVAALDYSKNTTVERKALLAKYRFVILGFSKTMGTLKLEQMASELKAKNSSLRLAQYIAMNEAKCESASNQDTYAVTTEVNKNNWWLRNAAGTRVQWTTSYNNCDVNFSAYAPKNAKGQTYAQFKWEHDYNAFFKSAPSVDYVFVDNFWHETRTNADWKRNGVNLAPKNTEANYLMQDGYANFARTVRAATPRLKVIGNINHDLSMTRYAGVLDGAFIEGLMGKSWSSETWAGWDAMMKIYRGALKRTNDAGNVFLNTFAAPTDYKTIRYGLASALMEDGYFLHIPLTGTMQPNWVDEYGIPLGNAVEPPPTAPAQNGIWKRTYSNGLALVNPSKTATASITIGSGYKRIAGAQDPAVNNGKAETVVTLGPRQGLLMVRQ